VNRDARETLLRVNSWQRGYWLFWTMCDAFPKKMSRLIAERVVVHPDDVEIVAVTELKAAA
jgi:hypothetical protein